MTKLTPNSLRFISAGLYLLWSLLWAAPSANANVYATNIKLNGSLTGTTNAHAASVTISYILNEPAPAGITIKILSGATSVRTIPIASGPGTLSGTNAVIWDGKDDSAVFVPQGNYNVQVTAASSGYTVWTQIVSNCNTKVYWPSGIAVDTSANSPY